MRKLIAAAAVLAGVTLGSSAYADKVSSAEGFGGGYYIFMLSGNWCLMGPSDPGANGMFATALAGLNNGHDVVMYTASQLGAYWGTYGGPNCAEVQEQ
jgi:hypothetical protein